jgi:alpha-L-arabinofuranosidase
VPFLKNGEMETLRAGDPDDFNSVTNPKLIYPTSKTVTITGKKLIVNLDPVSVNVIILDYKKPR